MTKAHECSQKYCLMVSYSDKNSYYINELTILKI